jgi:malate/lactate dehydrogenase
MIDETRSDQAKNGLVEKGEVCIRIAQEVNHSAPPKACIIFCMNPCNIFVVQEHNMSENTTINMLFGFLDTVTLNTR